MRQDFARPCCMHVSLNARWHNANSQSWSWLSKDWSACSRLFASCAWANGVWASTSRSHYPSPIICHHHPQSSIVHNHNQNRNILLHLLHLHQLHHPSSITKLSMIMIMTTIKIIIINHLSRHQLHHCGEGLHTLRQGENGGLAN